MTHDRPACSSFAIDVPDALLARARAGTPRRSSSSTDGSSALCSPLALRMSGDREEARDVLQETMLKVLGRIGEFRGDGIAVLGLAAPDRGQRSADAPASRSTPRKEIGVDDTRMFAEDHAPLPPAAADAAILQRALATCLTRRAASSGSTTPRATRHEEIATLMQRTASFSKSQLARGTKKLRAVLEVTEHAHA
jgi:RNA polymerase sigma-70 factor (ECF subfamily)